MGDIATIGLSRLCNTRVLTILIISHKLSQFDSFVDSAAAIRVDNS